MQIAQEASLCQSSWIQRNSLFFCGTIQFLTVGAWATRVKATFNPMFNFLPGAHILNIFQDKRKARYYNVTSDISVLSYLLTIRLSCTPARPPFHYKGECITQRAGWVQLITTFFACRTINSISHGRARSQTNCYLC